MNELAPLFALVLMMAASLAIGAVANRAESGGGFLSRYFLGNRGLGPWSMALTATVMSGGTFMGFPALIYQYGWSLALWIASYMMVALCTFGILGKRMAQLSRSTGAVTLPDLLRERFRSPALGSMASAFLILILSFSLIAQFKGGALILQEVLPGSFADGEKILGQPAPFVYGLIVFAIVVVTYTAFGGFLAAVWTDLFQSVLMLIGVLILLPLVWVRAGGLEGGTTAGVAAVGSGYAFPPGPGREFLPITLALSFFCMWSIAGLGQPATLLRLMAFRDTPTLRKAMGLLAVYNTLIYLPLVFIFICARGVFPTLERPDEVMPKLAVTVASPAIAGLILAAPFGAVMATVSAYLVQISSALVQDVYHRWVNPQASPKVLQRLSYASVVVVAIAAASATMRSPTFLQAIIVFAGGTAACTFLVPCVMAAYWERATARGAMAAMLSGALTTLVLYSIGWVRQVDSGIGEKSEFAPYYLFGFAPYVWGLLASALAGIVVTLQNPEKTPAERRARPELAVNERKCR